MTTIFQQTYCGESIVDLDRDISEMLDADYNPAAAQIPVNELGFHKGTFTVTVEWINDDVQ